MDKNCFELTNLYTCKYKALIRLYYIKYRYVKFIEQLKSKANLPIIFVLLLLTIGRILISGQGYLDDSDEVDFYAAERAFEALTKFDITGVSEHISFTEGKPTEALSKMLLVPVHRAYSWLIYKYRYDNESLLILGYYNIAISVILLYVFYLILLNLKLSRQSSAIGVMALGIFINFNLYTRHLLGYDLGLLFQMVALYFITSPKIELRKKYVWAGFFSALGFTTYHGYFMLVAILFLFLMLEKSENDFSIKKKPGIFILSFSAVILFYEVFYWLSKHSFFVESFIISGTIDQGSFSEGFSFAVKYLYTVEGIFGIGMLLLFATKVVTLAFKKKFTAAEKLVLLSLFAYLLYGFASVVLMKMVFYGRILHMYFPFLVLGVLLLLEDFKFTQSKYVAAVVLFGLSFQYAYNINSMNSITYPRKVMHDFGLGDNTVRGVNMNFKYELAYTENYINSPFSYQLAGIPNQLAPGNYDILNTCFFRHYPDYFKLSYKRYKNTEGQKVFSKKHFMSYPAYTFEYCSMYGRKFYINKNFRIEIVKRQEGNSNRR